MPRGGPSRRGQCIILGIRFHNPYPKTLPSLVGIRKFFMVVFGRVYTLTQVDLKRVTKVTQVLGRVWNALPIG